MLTIDTFCVRRLKDSAAIPVPACDLSLPAFQHLNASTDYGPYLRHWTMVAGGAILVMGRLVMLDLVVLEVAYTSAPQLWSTWSSGSSDVRLLLRLRLRVEVPFAAEIGFGCEGRMRQLEDGFMLDGVVSVGKDAAARLWSA